MFMSRLPLALLICLASTSYACATTKKTEILDCSKVEIDGSTLSAEDNAFLDSIHESITISEAVGYAIGADTLLNRFISQNKGKAINPDVLQLIKLYKLNSINKLMDRDYELANNEVGTALESHGATKPLYEVAECRLRGILSTTPNAYNSEVSKYLRKIVDKQQSMHNQVGYFDVQVNECLISKSVKTNNRYATLKPDPDARYLTVNATFKNTDNEGRIPFEGSLIISKDGKNYKFDTTETILTDGYGIRLRSINPFIKLNTKIVYKVPNELSGEVYWKPGRNAEDQKLWCTFLPEA